MQHRRIPWQPHRRKHRATAQRVGQYFRRHSNDIPAGLLQHEVDVDRMPNNELTVDWHNNIGNFSTQNSLLSATHSCLNYHSTTIFSGFDISRSTIEKDDNFARWEVAKTYMLGYAIQFLGLSVLFCSIFSSVDIPC